MKNINPVHNLPNLPNLFIRSINRGRVRSCATERARAQVRAYAREHSWEMVGKVGQVGKLPAGAFFDTEKRKGPFR